jgi:hypothetical protein
VDSGRCFGIVQLNHLKTLDEKTKASELNALRQSKNSASS